MDDWRKRIVSSPAVQGGEACVRGTRIAVSVIVDCLASGDDEDKILSAHPQLQPADIRATLAYAAEVLRQERLVARGLLDATPLDGLEERSK